GGLDPQMLMQFSQALQKLPKGQMQRLQAIMQKAMAGKDVTREAEEFEKTLPPEFKTMMQSFKMPDEQAGGEAPPTAEASETPAMSEEEARRLVAEAAEQGKISE